MSVFKSLMIAAAFIPAVATAQAQPAPTVAKPVTRADLVKELDASFANIDTNRDGSITTAEADVSQQRAAQQAAIRSSQVAQQQFTRLDTDKNGQLSLAEFQAGANKPRMVPGQQALNLLDANKDQKVTVAEFRAKRLAQFDAVDANRDGTLTPQELQAARRR